jgi:hypothetical protein
MTITDEAVSILSPNEMRETRRLYGLNLATISRYTDNSTTQLSQYENARNGLRADQLQRCKEILLGAVAKRAERIQNLIAREQQKGQTAALRHANAERMSSTDRISP